MAREQRVSLCDCGVAFPSAVASHTAADRGTKVAVLTAEVRLAGVLCSGSGLAPVSQTSVCPWDSSSSSPAATPPSALLLLLLPRIPSLPSGDSWRLRTVQHLLGRVWGKAVSRLVPKQDSHHRCQLGCVELTKGVDLVGLGHDGVPGRIAGHDGRLCVLNWGEEKDGSAFTHAAVCAGSRAGQASFPRRHWCPRGEDSGKIEQWCRRSGVEAGFEGRAGRGGGRERAKRERSRARKKRGREAGEVIGRHDNSRNQQFGWGMKGSSGFVSWQNRDGRTVHPRSPPGELHPLYFLHQPPTPSSIPWFFPPTEPDRTPKRVETSKYRYPFPLQPNRARAREQWVSFCPAPVSRYWVPSRLP